MIEDEKVPTDDVEIVLDLDYDTTDIAVLDEVVRTELKSAGVAAYVTIPIAYRSSSGSVIAAITADVDEARLIKDRATDLAKVVAARVTKAVVDTSKAVAPVTTTTDAPVVDTTDAPIIGTTVEAVTTEAVVDTTEAAAVTTASPVVDTTDAPIIETTAETVTTEAVVDTTEAETVTTEAVVDTTEASAVTTEAVVDATDAPTNAPTDAPTIADTSEPGEPKIGAPVKAKPESTNSFALRMSFKAYDNGQATAKQQESAVFAYFVQQVGVSNEEIQSVKAVTTSTDGVVVYELKLKEIVTEDTAKKHQANLATKAKQQKGAFLTGAGLSVVGKAALVQPDGTVEASESEPGKKKGPGTNFKSDANAADGASDAKSSGAGVAIAGVLGGFVVLVIGAMLFMALRKDDQADIKELNHANSGVTAGRSVRTNGQFTMSRSTPTIQGLENPNYQVEQVSKFSGAPGARQNAWDSGTSYTRPAVSPTTQPLYNEIAHQECTYEQVDETWGATMSVVGHHGSVRNTPEVGKLKSNGDFAC